MASSRHDAASYLDHGSRQCTRLHHSDYYPHRLTHHNYDNIFLCFLLSRICIFVVCKVSIYIRQPPLTFKMRSSRFSTDIDCSTYGICISWHREQATLPSTQSL